MENLKNLRHCFWIESDFSGFKRFERLYAFSHGPFCRLLFAAVAPIQEPRCLAGDVTERSKIVRRLLKDAVPPGVSDPTDSHPGTPKMSPPHLLILKLSNRPDEPRQFPCNSHRGNHRFLVIAVHHPPELAIQSLIRTFGDRDDRFGLSLAPFLDRLPGDRTMAVMPGRFHQHAPEMGISRFGNLAATFMIARATFAGN